MNKLNYNSKKLIHLGFQIGLIIKAFDGLLEAIGGLLFIYFPQIIVGFVNLLVGGEIREDPKDMIVSLIVKWTEYGASKLNVFIGIYLLIIGIAKIGFVIALFRKKLGAYVVYLWILCLFVVYQTYRFIIGGEMFVFWLTLIDIIVIIFIWLEYLRLKKRI